jgi:excisionase family DNA binding protein
VSRGYLTTADAARYANCCPETIRRAIRTRTLRAVQLGRVHRTRTEWIDAWLFAELPGWTREGDPVLPIPATKTVN